MRVHRAAVRSLTMADERPEIRLPDQMRVPDQHSRFRRRDDDYGRPRRARPWIAVGAIVALIAAFVVLLVTDDGDDAPVGAGASAVPPVAE